MPSDPRLVISAFTDEFRKMKASAEKAISQLRDEDFYFKLHPEQCSIFTYIRHMAGNMKSRWTDFLTADGEKPTRNRDAEFVDVRMSGAEISKLWEEGWEIVFATLATLSDADLPRIVTIRTQPHTVALAITRQVSHYAWHVGQIVLLAKHIVAIRGQTWTYITIPPGESDVFNRKMGM